MLEQVATVLEKLAVYMDAMESEKADAIRADRAKLAGLLKEKYEEITGDTIDDDVLDKLSHADLDVLSTFERVTEASGSDLGSPSDKQDGSAGMTTKEAAEAADDSFLDWVMSSEE